jgi:hypothetical protein
MTSEISLRLQGDPEVTVPEHAINHPPRNSWMCTAAVRMYAACACFSCRRRPVPIEASQPSGSSYEIDVLTGQPVQFSAAIRTRRFDRVMSVTAEHYGELTHAELPTQLELPGGTVKGARAPGPAQFRAEIDRAK